MNKLFFALLFLSKLSFAGITKSSPIPRLDDTGKPLYISENQDSKTLDKDRVDRFQKHIEFIGNFLVKDINGIPIKTNAMPFTKTVEQKLKPSILQSLIEQIVVLVINSVNKHLKAGTLHESFSIVHVECTKAITAYRLYYDFAHYSLNDKNQIEINEINVETSREETNYISDKLSECYKYYKQAFPSSSLTALKAYVIANYPQNSAEVFEQMENGKYEYSSEVEKRVVELLIEGPEYKDEPVFDNIIYAVKELSKEAEENFALMRGED